jgi:hypothetical protein
MASRRAKSSSAGPSSAAQNKPDFDLQPEEPELTFLPIDTSKPVTRDLITRLLDSPVLIWLLLVVVRLVAAIVIPITDCDGPNAPSLPPPPPP